MTLVAAILLVVGSIFGLLAGLGILRFPDVYTRLHAAAKAGPLGAGLILLSVAAASGDVFIAVRCIAGLIFMILVSPISAHLLARAALRVGTPGQNITSIEESA